MESRLQKKIKLKLKAARERKITWLFLGIGLVAIVLSLYSGRQYNLTIISLKPILLMHLAAGLAFGSLTFRYKFNSKAKDFNSITHFLWATLVYGQLITGLFYITNRKFADTRSEILQVRIIDKHEAYRSLTNKVTVALGAIEKEISFPESDMSQISNANYVNLKVINGAWNFKLILESKLTYLAD